jgi:hypothetical protein
MLYKNPVCTSQETHYVSTTKPNRLMLFGETVAVYCENHTDHTDTLCVQNAEFWYVNPVRTSKETHYVSTTKPNRLMLFGERAAVYCENHMCVGRMQSFGMLTQSVPQRKHITSPVQSPTG